MREKVWDWWTGTARERLELMPWAPFGVVIVMAIRWHVDNFTGRLLGRKVDAEAGGQRYSLPWVEYRLPALAEQDDPLGRKPGRGSLAGEVSSGFSVCHQGGYRPLQLAFSSASLIRGTQGSSCSFL